VVQVQHYLLTYLLTVTSITETERWRGCIDQSCSIIWRVRVSHVKPSVCHPLCGSVIFLNNSRFLAACKRLEKLVLPSVFDTSLFMFMTYVKLAELSNNSSELKNVTFLGDQTYSTLTPPTYFQGVKMPNPQNVRPWLCKWYSKPADRWHGLTEARQFCAQWQQCLYLLPYVCGSRQNKFAASLASHSFQSGKSETHWGMCQWPIFKLRRPRSYLLNFLRVYNKQLSGETFALTAL